MNLKELLEKYQVEIPILQRDYAQGRKSQEKIAKEFLASIFEVLEGKKEILHIDFIFGYEENKEFLLIDGQQRITTLWLLHFYLYKKAGILEDIKPLLQKFSYSVRKSSKKFCKNLLKKPFNINERPSKIINSMGSELESEENLRNDPTIKAMLHMLDLIYEMCGKKNAKKLAERLDNITFNLCNMGEFGLGEELYIKMNARGKQLSKYENLKAFIEKDPKILKNQELLTNIDNKWADYFFDPKNPRTFDIRGRNFLHYANLFFLLEKNNDAKNIESTIENPDITIDEFYQPLQQIENIELLDRVIGLLPYFSEFIDPGLNQTLKLSNPNFFSGESDGRLSYIDICYFFSLLSFIKNHQGINEINKESLQDYLRICRHFIENHRLDNPKEHIPSFFKLFKHLSQGYENIYQFLVENPTYNFHSNIYSLEVRKAELILKSREGKENWEEILNQTSDHEILKGWVDFLLDFSDEEFFKPPSKKSSNKKIQYQKPNLEKFQQYAKLTMEIFNKEKFLEKNLALFQKAFLCVGDYSFYTTNWFYGNIPTDIFRDREALNWMLSGTKNSRKKPYFKEFLDKLLQSPKETLVDKMQEIIDNTNLSSKQWWEQLLIRQQELFAFLNEKKGPFYKCRRIRYFNKKSRRIIDSIKNVSKVDLLPDRSNKKNVRDLLDYGLYCYCKEKTLDVSEYENDEEQYGDIEKPHFALNGKPILCDSSKTKIIYDSQEYPINLEKINVFDEFERILKEIKKA